MSKKLSVIIVSYNTSDLLKQCLTALYNSDLEEKTLEVFVVDNASADNSVEMVREEFPDVHLLPQSENLGFAAANNLAYRQSSGDYIFLLNPDAQVEATALRELTSYMEAHPACAIAGGRIMTADGNLAPSARAFPGFVNRLLVLTGLSSRFPNSRFFGRPDMTYLDDSKPVDVDWVPGTFSCISRKMLDQIGFFDERFFMYYEETDLCLRANRNDWKVMFIPWARVWHVGGACSKTRKDMTFDSAGSQLLNYRLRSELLYWRKNFGFFPMVMNTGLEYAFNCLRALKNSMYGSSKKQKKQESIAFLKNARAAFKDTKTGKQSPPAPW